MVKFFFYKASDGMFFIVSKIVWALISPLNFILLMLLAGVGIVRFCRRAGIFLIGMGMLLFFITGMTPLGNDLLAGLENHYSRPAKLPHVISGIIILGGAFDTEISTARHVASVNDNMERVLEGVRLAKEYPLAIPVFSGGEGRLLQKAQPEAREVAAWLEQAGYEHDRFIFEEQSRNTYENIRNTMEMMNPGPEEIWIVVTSAYHMPRTMAVFKSLGWRNVIPWPTDYRTDGKMRWLPEKFDVAGNAYKMDLAVHEWIGMIGYVLSGKISSR